MPVVPGDFAPFEAIAAVALPHAPAGDPSHDASHLLRVWRNCRAIAEADGIRADMAAVAAACLLHDCVNLRKDDPRRPLASRMAAAKACEIMAGTLAPGSLALMRGAIESHSFSAGIPAQTAEDALLRDADRLDALGAIGIARLFVTSGLIGRGLYDPSDPHAENRDPDDIAFALDHFGMKLLTIEGSFLTRSGRRLAAARTEDVRLFLRRFHEDIAHGAPEREPGVAPIP